MNILRAILLICFLAIPLFIMSLIMPALGKMSTYFHIGFRKAEFGIWIIMLGYLLGQMLYVPLTKCFNTRVSLRIGLLVVLVATGIMHLATLATSIQVFQIGELVCGLGLASCFCCTYTLINDNYSPKFIKKLLPYSIFTYTILPALATQLVSTLAENSSWTGNISAIALTALLVLALSFLFKKKPIPSPKSNKPQKRKVNYKVLVTFALAVSVSDYMVYGYAIAMPDLSTHVLEINLSTYGNYAVWLSLLTIPAFFLSYYALNRLGARSAQLYGAFGTLILTFMLYALRFVPVHIVTPVFVTYGLMNITTAVLFPAAAYLASNASSDKQYAGSLMGFINVGGILLGLLLQNYLPFSPFNSYLIVFFVFLAVACALSLAEKKGKHAYD